MFWTRLKIFVQEIDDALRFVLGMGFAIALIVLSAFIVDHVFNHNMWAIIVSQLIAWPAGLYILIKMTEDN